MKAPFQSDPTSTDVANAATYVQTNLVSDIAGLATVTNTNLVNPWGVSFLPSPVSSPFWISDQGSNVATVFPVTDSTDVSQAILTVHIPTTATGPQGPTGQVSNTNASSFILQDGASAHFIFANLNGTISAWDSGPTASVEVTTPGAVYTGLAVNEAHTMLYAANDSAGTIDVFDSSFAPVNLGDHAFQTPGQIAARGLVPFNATDIGGEVYVTYAPSGRAAQTTAGLGDGAVAIFSESGKLEPHGVLLGGPHTPLAAPWGVAIAPDDFGQFSGDLLVGNFSFQHSEINAFDLQTHQFEGTIPISPGSGNTSGGLWALTFGGGGRDGSPNTLYFTDGIDGETHGLFGAIESMPLIGASTPTHQTGGEMGTSAAKTITVTDPPASGASGPAAIARTLSDLMSQFGSHDATGAPNHLSGTSAGSLMHSGGPIPDIAALTERFMGAPFVSGGTTGLLPSSLAAEEQRAFLALHQG